MLNSLHLTCHTQIFFLELRMKVAGLCDNLYTKVSTYMRMKYINKEAVL